MQAIQYPGLEALKPTYKSVKTEGEKVYGLTNCGKCYGTGCHWAGQCWLCRGSGNGKWERIDQQGWEARMTARTKAAEKREAARIARATAMKNQREENHRLLGIEDAEAVKNAYPRNTALASILDCSRPLTEKQVALVHKILADEAERAVKAAAAATVEVKEGRQIIEGRVLSVRQKDSAYGVVYKMLIERTDAVKFYGTVPATLDHAIPGDIVRFTGKVEKGSEPGFNFFSRPTKGEIITRCEAGQKQDAEEAARRAKQLETDRWYSKHLQDTAHLV